ncbi:uncharacterized protein BKA55DRAFT_582023 [Fusarium redolens]|uniref:Uncharacterized protein n=1 Tax=Fusarium redolens TaxID=48865 RepID=A0A9P9G0Y4_FUSRE|nr:uncharacterized protein BKA55DRAFT_582023 [Fusarium redolens]KAH7231235.1 hypothetical protein BKA55DRAFT_582023 [Fusarium redolens]
MTTYSFIRRTACIILLGSQNWSKDRSFQGAPSPVMIPGILTGVEKSIRDPF